MRRILLDTHVFLWMHGFPDRLGPARSVLGDPESALILSVVTSWEIAIKWSLGKLVIPEAPEVYVPERIRRSALGVLPVTHHHALAVSSLPDLHRDPFDRLLIAQARVESLELATADERFRDYPVEVLWAG